MKERASFMSRADWSNVNKLKDNRFEEPRILYAANIIDPQENSFENLVITKIDNKVKRMVVRYLASENWLESHSFEKDMNVFTGMIEYLSIDGNVVAKSMGFHIFQIEVPQVMIVMYGL